MLRTITVLSGAGRQGTNTGTQTTFRNNGVIARAGITITSHGVHRLRSLPVTNARSFCWMVRVTTATRFHHNNNNVPIIPIIPTPPVPETCFRRRVGAQRIQVVVFSGLPHVERDARVVQTLSNSVD